MNNQPFDRRQMPRAPVSCAIECRLDLRTRVRLLDISVSGALLAAEVPLPIGAAGNLRAGLDAGPFGAQVEVKRSVVVSHEPSLSGLATVFIAMDDRSRHALEAFLRKAAH
jgi:hypothetical protein